LNYLKLHEGFYQWCEINYLPALSQLLFLKIVHIFNKCGWVEWVQVDNQRLMSEVQITNKNTFLNYRDKLIGSGLIEFEKGKKNRPNSYKLGSILSSNFDLNFDSQLTYFCTKAEPQTGHINKLNKTKLNTTPESTNVLSSPKQGARKLTDPMFIEFWNAYPRKQNQPSAVRAFGKITMSRAVLDEILAGIERYKNSGQWANAQYIPHPATFLNGRRWRDEIEQGGQTYATHQQNSGPKIIRKCINKYPE
jgi:hypothetical protein